MVKAPKAATPKTAKSLKALTSPGEKTPKTGKAKSPAANKSVEKPMKKEKLQKKLDKMTAGLTGSPVTEVKTVKSPKMKGKKKNKKQSAAEPETEEMESNELLSESDVNVEVEKTEREVTGTESIKEVALGLKNRKQKLKELKLRETAKKFTEDLVPIRENAMKAFDALLKLSAQKKSNALFQDLHNKVLMEVTTWNALKYKQFINIRLPHSILPENKDVVFVMKHDKEDEEDAVEDELKTSLFKQKMLTEHGIKLREVYTLRQFKNEFSTFEAKRTLCKRVDAFLADKTIFKHIPAILGREMYKRRTPLFPINMGDKTYKNHTFIAQNINKALNTTVCALSDRGPYHTVMVGIDELNPTQLTENVVKVCLSLRKSLSGGWPNVKELSVRAFDLKLPIHFATGAKEITKPINKGRKLREVVEGEISTQLNKKVTVYPDGNIKIKTEKGDDESDVDIPDDDEVANDSDVAEEDEEMDSD